MMTFRNYQMLCARLLVDLYSLELRTTANETSSRTHNFILLKVSVVHIFTSDLLRSLLGLVPRYLVQMLKVLEDALLFIEL